MMIRSAVLGVVCMMLAGAARPPEPAVVAAPKDAPPADSVVLSLAGHAGANRNWLGADGKAADWKDADGLEVHAGHGNITSRETFGDAQIHVEFMTPSPAKGEGQDRGNSGVYIQGRYEVQVLDSFKSSTYTDGQCGAIYKKHAPLVNVCREPGEMQVYDIVFRAPRFDGAGKKTANAFITVFQNGVLIHDHAEVDSPTGSASVTSETPGNFGIMLQDHGHAVRYGTIWVRRL